MRQIDINNNDGHENKAHRRFKNNTMANNPVLYKNRSGNWINNVDKLYSRDVVKRLTTTFNLH